VPATSPNTTAKRPAAKAPHHNLVKRPTAQLRWPRVSVVVGAAVGIGLGAWGLMRVVKDKEETQLNRTSVSNSSEPNETSNSEPSLDALTDTITREIAAVSDSTSLFTPSETVPTVSDGDEQLDTPASSDTIYQEPEGPEESEAIDSASSGN
jgi:hypothetical protein